MGTKRIDRQTDRHTDRYISKRIAWPRPMVKVSHKLLSMMNSTLFI